MSPHGRPDDVMTIAAETVAFTAALTHASRHRAELDRSEQCGCFFCFLRFRTADIRSWIDNSQTALCPRCGIDSVLGTASGLTVDDRFLRKLHRHHFGAVRR